MRAATPLRCCHSSAARTILVESIHALCEVRCSKGNCNGLLSSTKRAQACFISALVSMRPDAAAAPQWSARVSHSVPGSDLPQSRHRQHKLLHQQRTAAAGAATPSRSWLTAEGCSDGLTRQLSLALSRSSGNSSSGDGAGAPSTWALDPVRIGRIIALSVAQDSE